MDNHNPLGFEIRVRSILPKDYSFVLSLDSSIFPISNPVTKEALALWYQYNPEFGMIYEDCCSNRVVACALTIPLEKSGWLNLIEGQLEESKVEGHHIFNPNKKPNSVGLHIYHVEVLDSRIRQFYTRFLTDINAALAKLRESIHVIGLSAYCVTEAGNGLFEKNWDAENQGEALSTFLKASHKTSSF